MSDGRSRSMSDRRPSGRGSRPSWRRSPPTRSNCRSIGSRCYHGSTNYLPRGLRLLRLARDRDGRQRRSLVARQRAAGEFSRRGRETARRAGRSASSSLRGARPRRTAGGWRWRCCRALAPTARSRTIRRRPTPTAPRSPMWPSMPRPASIEVVDYVVVDDVGRIINPDDPARSGDRRGGAGPGQRVQRGDRLRRERAAAGRLARRLPGPASRPTIRTCARSRSKSILRRTIRSAPRARARAASSRSAARSSNAVAAALSSLGVEPRVLPLTPSRVWQLIQDAPGA